MFAAQEQVIRTKKGIIGLIGEYTERFVGCMTSR